MRKYICEIREIMEKKTVESYKKDNKFLVFLAGSGVIFMKIVSIFTNVLSIVIQFIFTSIAFIIMLPVYLVKLLLGLASAYLGLMIIIFVGKLLFSLIF